MFEATLTTTATVRFLYRGKHFVDLGYATAGHRVAFGPRVAVDATAAEFRRAGFAVDVRPVRYLAD